MSNKIRFSVRVSEAFRLPEKSDTRDIHSAYTNLLLIWRSNMLAIFAFIILGGLFITHKYLVTTFIYLIMHAFLLILFSFVCSGNRFAIHFIYIMCNKRVWQYLNSAHLSVTHYITVFTLFGTLNTLHLFLIIVLFYTAVLPTILQEFIFLSSKCSTYVLIKITWCKISSKSIPFQQSYITLLLAHLRILYSTGL